MNSSDTGARVFYIAADGGLCHAGEQARALAESLNDRHWSTSLYQFNPSDPSPFDIRPWIELRNRVRDLDPDIIHCFVPAKMWIGLKCALYGVFTKSLVASLLEPPIGFSFASTHAMKEMRAVIVPSSNWAAELSHVQNVSASPPVVVPSTAHSANVRARLGISDESLIISCMGRLVPENNFISAIWALDILRFVYPNIGLLIIGDGPQKSELFHFASRMKIDKHITFEAPHKSTCLLRAADIHWMVSENDPGPWAALNAMAAGLPIVAVNHPDLREYVNEESGGVLVPRNDKPALARATKNLLDDWAVRNRLSRQAEEHFARKYGPELLIPRYEAIYRRHIPS